MADNAMAEFAAVFVEEAGGRLAELRRSVDALAGDPANAEECEKTRISSHTIRGMAAQMGYEDIAKISKEVELLFVELKKKGAAPSADMVAGARDCAAALQKLFDALKTGGAAGVDAEPLASRMQAFTRSLA